MTRLGIILVFGVIVLAESITLGVGWHVGSQTRRECEEIARQRHASGGPQYAVQDCLAARLLHGGA